MMLGEMHVPHISSVVKWLTFIVKNKSFNRLSAVADAVRAIHLQKFNAWIH